MKKIFTKKEENWKKKTELNNALVFYEVEYNLYNPYFASHTMNCQHIRVYRLVFSQHYDYLKFFNLFCDIAILKK